MLSASTYPKYDMLGMISTCQYILRSYRNPPGLLSFTEIVDQYKHIRFKMYIDKYKLYGVFLTEYTK